MINKIWPRILILIVAVTTLGAGRVKVRVWDHHIHDKPYRIKMFKKFNREHPDVKIEYTSLGSGMMVQMLNLAFKTGDPPEVFKPQGELTLIKLMDLGWIVPLDDIAPDPATFKAWKARFPAELKPFVEGLNMFNGKIYSFPVSAPLYGNLLFYNKKLFREAGIVDENGEPTPPTTWSEFREYAKRITQAGKGRYYGVALMAKQPGAAFDMSLLSTLAKASGYYHSSTFPNNLKTGRFDYSSPILRKAIQLWIDIKNDGSILPGYASMDDETARIAFAMNRAGMIFGGFWVVAGFLAINPNCDFDVALPPVMDGVKRVHPWRDIGGGGSYVVAKPCKHPDAVWKVIDFLSSYEFREGWVKYGGGISFYPQINKPENFPHPTLAKIAQWSQKYLRLGPIIRPEARRVADYMEPVHPDIGNTILGIFLGKVGFEALDDLERRMNAAFDRAMEKARKDGLHITREDFIFPDFDITKNEDYVPQKR